jgi:hemoglobin
VPSKSWLKGDSVPDRPTLYEYAGGDAAMTALVDALHERCLTDPELNHAFIQASNPEHLRNLSDYFAEVFGGPRVYSESHGGHSRMLGIHASTGADDEFTARFVTCFDQAVDDAGLPEDEEFRRVLHEYMVWAANEVNDYGPIGSVVPEDLPFPYWSWTGRQP